jgi:hypothetical protein
MPGLFPGQKLKHRELLEYQDDEPIRHVLRGTITPEIFLAHPTKDRQRGWRYDSVSDMHTEMQMHALR